MGTNVRQIATQTDVNNKRINAFSEGTRCPTKEEIEKVEFLQVTNRTASVSLSPLESYNIGINNDIQMEITDPWMNSQSNYINNTNVFISNKAVYANIYAPVANNSSSQATLSFIGRWPSSTEVGKYAIYYFSATNLPIGRNCSLITNSTIKIIQNDNISSAAGAVEIYASSVSWTIGYMIVDSQNKVITTISPSNYTTNYVSRTINFVPTTSTVRIYCIIPQIEASFFGVSNISNYTGFMISVADKISYNESYYDNDYKLVQYQDISHKSGATFTIYYGVWNNKSSKAKLDNVHVEIKKQSDSSWTTIGTTALGTVNTSKTGTITCTLPTNFDPAVLYDLRVVCGATTYNQNWKYRWGNSSTLTSSGYPWTTYSSSAKTGVCGPTSLNNSNGTSVLANDYYSTVPGLHRGRSTTYAALFQIT